MRRPDLRSTQDRIIYRPRPVSVPGGACALVNILLTNNCYIEAWIENMKEKHDIEDGVNLGQIITNSNYGKGPVWLE